MLHDQLELRLKELTSKAMNHNELDNVEERWVELMDGAPPSAVETKECCEGSQSQLAEGIAAN